MKLISLQPKTFIFLFMFSCFFCINLNAQIAIGTTQPSQSALLDLSSTEKGVLIPRLTDAQRDAIASPTNGLLIFSTTNNTFQVYKATCSCWITIFDGGNTAPTVVNTPPSASSLNYSGKSIVGQSITLTYIYSDAQSDAEGLTGFQWQVATSSSGFNTLNIFGATTSTYTPVSGNVGKWIRCIVTPRAATGVLNGVQSFGSWMQVEDSTIPTANNLTVSGTPAQGSTLTANYTFAGGSGVEDTNLISGTTYLWQTSPNNTGSNISSAPLYGNFNYINTFTPQVDLLGRYVRVGVRAKDNANVQAVNFVFSPWVGPLIPATEQAPVANNITITPAPAVNGTMTASYTYSDINNDPEGATTIQWYRADDVNGTNQVAISGATSNSYLVTTSDVGKFIGFGVKPMALSGITNGTEVVQYHPSSTLPLAAFTFTSSPVKQLPFFAANRVMNSQNTIEIEINVTTPGGIIFSSSTVNGYSFSTSITATTTGNQWITLIATGTQTAYNAAGDVFNIIGVAGNTDVRAVTIFNSITGQGLTAFSNGGSLNETFNNNTTCQNAIISQGQTTSTCSGTLTTSARTYNLVHINGQCWMVQNAAELPTAPCAASINTGCNTWMAVTVPDNGYWGYYNATNLTGSAGWATVEPVANEGLLYQWNAAMNGSTEERSKGICPSGWHIPSDCEWLYLEHGLGMSIAQQAIDNNTRTTTGEGNKLKLTGSGANNSSGFTALMPGYRYNPGGGFTDRGIISIFWTSTKASATAAFRRTVNLTSAGISRSSLSGAFAVSVRCLKD